MLDKVKDGSATAKQDSTTTSAGSPTAASRPTSSSSLTPRSPTAKKWGMNTEMEDLNRVVAQAKKQGGKVVVAALARRIDDDGVRDLGLQGQAGRRWPVRPRVHRRREQPDAGERRRRAEGARWLDKSDASPWLTFGGIAAPYTGLFNSTGALGADHRSGLAVDRPGVPAAAGEPQAPVPATNLGSTATLRQRHVAAVARRRAGAHRPPGESGDPRGWVDDEITPIKRYATMFGGWGLKGLDGTAWYHPLKLTIDSAVVAAGNKTPARRSSTCTRRTQGSSEDAPHVRVRAALGGTRVIDATTALAKQSGDLEEEPRAGRSSRDVLAQRPGGGVAGERLRQEPHSVPEEDRRLGRLAAGERVEDRHGRFHSRSRPINPASSRTIR